MSNTLKGILLACTSAVCWGTYGTFVTLLSRVGFSPDSIALFCPMALIFLFLISELIRHPQGLKLNLHTFFTCLICGLVASFGTNLFYVFALANGISVAMASAITFCNYFFVMIASRFIWKISVTLPKIIAGLLALTGISLLLEVWIGLNITVISLFFIFIVTITFAVGFVGCSFAVTNQKMDVDAFFFWINLIGFIPLAIMNPPWNVFGEIASAVSNYGFYVILLLIGLCFIPQMGNYYFTGCAMKYIRPALVSIIFTLDPIVASILGFVVLNQELHAIQIIGIAIIISSVLWVNMIEFKGEKESSATCEKAPIN